jgi:hypothetical protein
MHIRPEGTKFPVIEKISKKAVSYWRLAIAVLQILDQIVAHGCKVDPLSLVRETAVP